MHLKVRICQYRGISFRTEASYSSPWFSNIRNHLSENDHSKMTENFKIISSSNKFDIRILESIFIHRESPTLKDQASSFKLTILG